MSSDRNPKENTSNREDYSTSQINDAPIRDSDIDYPSASNTPLPPSSPAQSTPNKHVYTTDREDFVDVELKTTPSPSTSDIIVNAHSDDMMQLSNLNRELNERNVDDKEIRKRVLELKEKLEKERADQLEEDEKEGNKKYFEDFDQFDD